MAKENIRSKTARQKLPARREPYWENLGRGVGIGVRRSANGGETWIGRKKNADVDVKYEYKSFGSDYEYHEARSVVLEWASGAPINGAETTVADVCRLYVENRKVEKGENTARDAELRFERLVYGTKFGKIELSKLSIVQVEKWRNSQLDDKEPEDEESYKRAKDTINRNLKSLKAALNYGKDRELVASDSGWKLVTQFPKVGARRKGWLTSTQRTQLLGVMPTDLRILCKALLLTGARPGEIAKANVCDFDPHGRLLRLEGKTGKREVPLSDKAIEFFSKRIERNGKPRKPERPLLVTADSKRWTAPVWGKMFREARDKAELPNAVLYCMRHTYISESIAQGIDIYAVAKLTGTSVAIIQSHYGNLTDNIRERLNRVSIL